MTTAFSMALIKARKKKLRRKINLSDWKVKSVMETVLVSMGK